MGNDDGPEPMNFCRRTPCPQLAPFVDWLWYYDGLEVTHDKEHVLPDGTFELIINLDNDPRRLFNRENFELHESFRRGWLSGTHSRYLVIDVISGGSMMGAHFKPGGAKPFLGMPADELCGKVLELDAVWGGDIWSWRDQLLAARGPEAKFRVLEELLLKRLSKYQNGKGSSRRAQWAVSRFMREPNVQCIGSIADELGVSHKHFIQEFRQETGLTPKLFCRIRRFQEVLTRIHSSKTVEWADV